MVALGKSPSSDRGADKPPEQAERAADVVPTMWLQVACDLSRWEALMESDRRFYERRVAEEASAARRAISPEAKSRHEELLRLYERKAHECALN